MTYDQASPGERDWASVDDKDLVAAIGAHHAAALDEVYRRHAPQVRQTASRVSGVRACDVVQEVFLDLWRRPGRFDPGRGSLGGFLAMQARTRSIDGVRSDLSRRARELATEPADVADTSIDRLVSRHHDNDIVRRALMAIPGPEREAVVLAFFGGHSYRDVARVLGAPEGTVKSRIRSGLSHLRAQFTADARLTSDARAASTEEALVQKQKPGLPGITPDPSVAVAVTVSPAWMIPQA